jgi:hypothetical protein
VIRVTTQVTSDDFLQNFSHVDGVSAIFLALWAGSGRLSHVELASTPPHGEFVAATKAEYCRLSRLARAVKAENLSLRLVMPTSGKGRLCVEPLGES